MIRSPSFFPSSSSSQVPTQLNRCQESGNLPSGAFFLSWLGSYFHSVPPKDRHCTGCCTHSVGPARHALGSTPPGPRAAAVAHWTTMLSTSSPAPARPPGGWLGRIGRQSRSNCFFLFSFRTFAGSRFLTRRSFPHPHSLKERAPPSFRSPHSPRPRSCT